MSDKGDIQNVQGRDAYRTGLKATDLVGSYISPRLVYGLILYCFFCFFLSNQPMLFLFG